MLIIFKSKSSPEVCMYQEHAQRILDLLGKSPTRGVITAAEADNALSILEKEVASSKRHPEHDAEHAMRQQEQDEGDNDEQAPGQHVSFAARAYPLMEMLRTAKAEGQDIIWSK
jgi:hypothetical protein